MVSTVAAGAVVADNELAYKHVYRAVDESDLVESLTLKYVTEYVMGLHRVSMHGVYVCYTFKNYVCQISPVISCIDLSVVASCMH